MKFFDPIIDRFFRPKAEKESGEEALEQQGQLEPAPPPPPEPAQIDLPHEHALQRLYDLRTEQAGGIPAPSLVLEGLEELSFDGKKREANRFRTELTAIAVSRLDEAIPKVEEKPLEEPEAVTDMMGGAEDEDGLAAEEIVEDEYEDTEEEVPPPELDALPFVFVSSDRMLAWVMVFPPVGGGKELDRRMLEEALGDSKVTAGIDEELLNRLPEASDRYFHIMVIAKGREAVHGENGRIVDFFSRVSRRKFEIDENGRVDYMALCSGQNAKQGDAICEMIPPTEGEDGFTVLGKELRAKGGRAVALPKGRNTEISPDGRKLIASQDGRVEFNGRSFQVNSVLEIYGNIDYSTGSVDFLGDVHIRGDVCSGFTVRATGDVMVDGVIEACDVEAGGDLVVVKGVAGNMENIVRVHHNIYSKYLGNSVVHARGNVHTDSIHYSNVYSDGEMQVCSGRGVIVGGKICVARGISAKVVGSKYESGTSIKLGGQPCADFERELLLRNKDKLREEAEKLVQQPDSPKKAVRLEKLRERLLVNGAKLKEFDEEIARLNEEMGEVKGIQLKCNIVYPGVNLAIGSESATLNQEISSCHARLVKGELVWT